MDNFPNPVKTAGLAFLQNHFRAEKLLCPNPVRKGRLIFFNDQITKN